MRSNAAILAHAERLFDTWPHIIILIYAKRRLICFLIRDRARKREGSARMKNRPSAYAPSGAL